tara:strand:+ start:565 stop:1008 length:444 start_codon:yes stop_codon:yes gene_type:complete
MTKKFKETKVGKFLVGKGGVFDTLGDALPEKGFLGVLKNLIDQDDALPPQDKETALKLLEMDLEELRGVSNRWASDMTSDSWLSKNTRPLVLIYLTFATTLFVVLDSINSPFAVNTEWIELLKTLLVTTYVAYFGSRGIEKYKAIGK